MKTFKEFLAENVNLDKLWNDYHSVATKHGFVRRRIDQESKNSVVHYYRNPSGGEGLQISHDDWDLPEACHILYDPIKTFKTIFTHCKTPKELDDHLHAHQIDKLSKGWE